MASALRSKLKHIAPSSKKESGGVPPPRPMDQSRQRRSMSLPDVSLEQPAIAHGIRGQELLVDTNEQQPLGAARTVGFMSVLDATGREAIQPGYTHRFQDGKKANAAVAASHRLQGARSSPTADRGALPAVPRQQALPSPTGRLVAATVSEGSQGRPSLVHARTVGQPVDDDVRRRSRTSAASSGITRGPATQSPTFLSKEQRKGQFMALGKPFCSSEDITRKGSRRKAPVAWNSASRASAREKIHTGKRGSRDDMDLALFAKNQARNLPPPRPRRCEHAGDIAASIRESSVKATSQQDSSPVGKVVKRPPATTRGSRLSPLTRVASPTAGTPSPFAQQQREMVRRPPSQQGVRIGSNGGNRDGEQAPRLHRATDPVPPSVPSQPVKNSNTRSLRGSPRGQMESTVSSPQEMQQTPHAGANGSLRRFKPPTGKSTSRQMDAQVPPTLQEGPSQILVTSETTSSQPVRSLPTVSAKATKPPKTTDGLLSVPSTASLRAGPKPARSSRSSRISRARLEQLQHCECKVDISVLPADQLRSSAAIHGTFEGKPNHLVDFVFSKYSTAQDIIYATFRRCVKRTVVINTSHYGLFISGGGTRFPPDTFMPKRRLLRMFFMRFPEGDVTLTLARLPEKKCPDVLVKIHLGAVQSLSMKVKDDTTLEDVEFKALKKAYEAKNFDFFNRKPHLYALYQRDASGSPVGAYLTSSEQLHEMITQGTREFLFALKGDRHDHRGITLQLINEVHYSANEIGCSPEMTAGELLIKALKSNPGVLRAQLHEYGIYVPPSDTRKGRFLHNKMALSDAGLTDQSVVALKLLYKTASVTLPDGTGAEYKFAPEATVQHCVDFFTFNIPELHETCDLYRLFVHNGPMLDNMRTLWSVPMPQEGLVLREGLQQLVVFFKNRQEILDVDYSVPLHQNMLEAVKVLGIKEVASTDYVVSQPGQEGAKLDPNLSLNEQGIPYNTTVILRLLRESAASLSVRLSEQDVPLWEEVCDSSTIVLDKDGMVEAATINQLICQLTGTTSPGMDFTEAFLLTYSSMMSPVVLVQKIIERFQPPPGKPYKTIIKQRVCEFLLLLLQRDQGHFNHMASQLLVDFIDDILSKETISVNSQPITVICNRLRKLVLERACHIRVQSQTFRKSYHSDHQISLSELGSYDTLCLLDEEEMAKQITLMDYSVYNLVKPEELLHLAWSKPETQWMSPHVMAAIRRFNRLSMWVASMVVEPLRSKDRSKRYAKIVRIAGHLRKLNNFSALMSLISGLNHASVARLKHTLACKEVKAVAKQLQSLETLMDSSFSYKAFRTAIAEVESSTPPIPAVPYIGVYLKDLTFIEEIPDRIGNLINFSKCLLLQKCIKTTVQFQNRSFGFKANPHVASQLTNMFYLHDYELYETSLLREPRGAKATDIL